MRPEQYARHIGRIRYLCACVIIASDPAPETPEQRRTLTLAINLLARTARGLSERHRAATAGTQE